jgi:hypothetical protein
MQGGADADHTRAKDDNIGFEVCHRHSESSMSAVRGVAHKLKLIFAARPVRAAK